METTLDIQDPMELNLVRLVGAQHQLFLRSNARMVVPVMHNNPALVIVTRMFWSEELQSVVAEVGIEPCDTRYDGVM